MHRAVWNLNSAPAEQRLDLCQAQPSLRTSSVRPHAIRGRRQSPSAVVIERAKGRRLGSSEIVDASGGDNMCMI